MLKSIQSIHIEETKLAEAIVKDLTKEFGEEATFSHSKHKFHFEVSKQMSRAGIYINEKKYYGFIRALLLKHVPVVIG